MAKVKRGFGLSGKLGDDVYVDSKRGNYVRKRTPAKSKKRLAVLKKQTSRNPLLNNLAGELNNIIRGYVEAFKPGEFYHNVLSLFRNEPEDNRFLLLHQLKGMEINPAYPMSRMGLHLITVDTREENLVFTLQATSHPSVEKDADCYCYELILIYWHKRKRPAEFSMRQSDWILMKDKLLPIFDFKFPRPASAVHWLLCIRQTLGFKGEEIGRFATQAMQIKEAGSFDKADIKLLEQRRKNKTTAKPPVVKVVKEEVRVKARK